MVILALIGLVAIAAGVWRAGHGAFAWECAWCSDCWRWMAWQLLALTGAALLGFAIGVLSAS